MAGKVNGKVAVVTGASKGIGASIAVHLAAAGANVVVNYAASRQGADRVVGEIPAAGGKAIAVQGTITIRTGSADGRVWIEVADTGQGIAPEHVKRIFDPFVTTKPVGKGTGLGLSVSYGIVKKHGGQIDVSSEPERGTRFRVWVPIARQPETGAALA